jgi:uncharacterized protein (DUF2342 family)
VNLYRSARAVAGARGDGPVDWDAAAEAAKAAVDPGELTLDEGERAGYADDVRDARDRIREVSGLAFDLPETVQIQHRHHWIDANVDTFARVLAPLAEESAAVPGAARAINTGSMAVALSFLANNVLGQYDPLLLADGDEHALYFVRPNILKVSASLAIDRDRFRRWIALHEVAHAAEFGAAPWLSAHLEKCVERGLSELSRSRLPRDALRELDTAMTAVEGYAELVMDRAFDGEFADLRRKLDERRQGRGPLTRLIRRALGLGLKRRQYERGKAFFETVADARGVAGASRVWDGPESLPTDAELDDPAKWLARVR